MNKAILLDQEFTEDLIEQRQKLGIDCYDEVWNGVYVMASMPNLTHQRIVRALTNVLTGIVVDEERGEVYPGANVSDRRTNWKRNFRLPDIVVVLEDSWAVDCGTHLFGGPDFLVEVFSPGDDTDLKIPFYSQIRVQELLVIHCDTRQLRLYRHHGEELAPVEPTLFEGKRWLVSDVLPLAFRRIVHKGKPRTELKRTDGKPGRWIV